MQSFLKTLLNYRKSSKAIHEGKTIHFGPRGGIYPLFRIYEDEIVGIIINKSEMTSVETEVVKEIGLNGKKVKDIITGKEFTWGEEININPKGVMLFTTKLN